MLNIRRLYLIVIAVAALSPGYAGDKPHNWQLWCSSQLLLQYNGTEYSKLTPVTAGFNGGLDWKFSYSWQLSIAVRGGRGRRALHGTPGSWVPVNSIALYQYDSDGATNAVIPGENFVQWQNSAAGLRVGYLDLFSIRNKQFSFSSPSGFAGFINPHFNRLLAVHAFEKEQLQLIPAVQFYWQILPWLRLQTALTAGDSDYHVFIRNTLPVELKISWTPAGVLQELILQAGFADADSSGTHRISPAAGVILRQNLGKGIVLFGGISSGRNRDEVNQIFTEYRQHYTAGMVWQLSHRADYGAAWSSLKSYHGTRSEQAYAVYGRWRLSRAVSMVVDLTFLKNAAGEQTPVWLPALLFRCQLPVSAAR